MGLGVWFSEDIAHVLRGVGEGVRLLVVQRGLQGAADTAYVAGYWAALQAVATSLGISDFGLRTIVPEAKRSGISEPQPAPSPHGQVSAIGIPYSAIRIPQSWQGEDQ